MGMKQCTHSSFDRVTAKIKVTQRQQSCEMGADVIVLQAFNPWPNDPFVNSLIHYDLRDNFSGLIMKVLNSNKQCLTALKSSKSLSSLSVSTAAILCCCSLGPFSLSKWLQTELWRVWVYFTIFVRWLTIDKHWPTVHRSIATYSQN